MQCLLSSAVVTVVVFEIRQYCLLSGCALTAISTLCRSGRRGTLDWELAGIWTEEESTEILVYPEKVTDPDRVAEDNEKELRLCPIINQRVPHLSNNRR